LGFTLQLASRIITSTEIHFVICGTSPSIISRSMLVWELLDKGPLGRGHFGDGEL